MRRVKGDPEPPLDVRDVGRAQVQAHQGASIDERRASDFDVVDAGGAHDLVVDGEDGAAEENVGHGGPALPALKLPQFRCGRLRVFRRTADTELGRYPWLGGALRRGPPAHTSRRVPIVRIARPVGWHTYLYV